MRRLRAPLRLRSRQKARPSGEPPRRRGLIGELCRIGLFIVVTAMTAGALHAGLRFGRPSSAAALTAGIEDRLLALSARLGFAVNDVAVEGRRTTDPATILKALGARRGTPIWAVDPGRGAARLAALPWVRSARVERRLPGTILVHLTERRPLALWQHGGRMELIDHDGAVIPIGDLGRFAKLPLVVGEDAARHADALIAILGREPDLASHVAAAIWVGDRRWNLRLDNAIEVLLPAGDPAAAWVELARLQRNGAILRRDVQAIDMRLPDRTVLRVAAPPPSEDTKKKGRPLARNT
ncbi:MAG TPA: FtsQ-type POTRA domain-containing protein [Stellaceae bacterium]|nr:FtsQ-type POTRA domain-containing protein [Stellaceae bacterium]